MIDVNGTRTHLLLGEDDWLHSRTPEGETENWHYDITRNVLMLTPRLFEFPSLPEADPLLIETRRGATRDRYGHWYWIGPDTTSIRVRWSQATKADHYWPSADQPTCQPSGAHDSPFQSSQPATPADPDELAGLAATTGHYLVAGVPSRGELLIFDLHTGGVPTRINLPSPPDGDLETISQPFAIMPLTNGGIAVLDRVNRLIWLLDATLRPETVVEAMPGQPLLFQPKSAPGSSAPDSSPTRTTPATWTAQLIELRDAIDPISIAPLPDGSMLVLDRGNNESNGGASVVRRYLPGGVEAIESVLLQEEDLRTENTPALNLSTIVAHDMAFVLRPRVVDSSTAEEVIGTLYVVNDAGNQAVALTVRLTPVPPTMVDLELSLSIQTTYFPLRGFTGKALVAPLDAEYAYFDRYERWSPVVALPRTRYAQNAVLDLLRFDGKEPGCVWHRLCMDACIPPDTAIRVQTRAADDVDQLPWQPWHDEPTLYQRHTGAETPYAHLWSEAERSNPETGTWELLFQQAQGRYLEIRLILIGNGRASPRIRALRAWYPRFSYLTNYLPDVYQQDELSAHFLDTFLANPEGFFTVLEGLIANIQVFFDVRTVPSHAVDWLADWLGLILDPAWSDYQRRLLIAHAPYFFLRRGTLPGLYQAILLVICPEMGPAIFQDESDPRRATVRIVERFRTRGQRSVALGDPENAGTDIAETEKVADHAHRFTVLLPASVEASQLSLVEQLMEIEKPAHTYFTIKQYWALFRIGEVRLGLDTTLGQGGRFQQLRLGDTALAEGILGAAYPYSLRDRIVLSK